MQPRQQPHSDPRAAQHAYAPGAVPHADPRAQLAPNAERFMAGVFGWMGLGLLITAAVSFGLSTQEALLYEILAGRLQTVVFIAPLIFVFLVAPRMYRMAPAMAKLAFFVYAALIGTWLSPLPVFYSVPEIFGTFIATAVMFGGMAAFGYFTKRDLSGVGRFLVMAVWGLFAAWLVSMFIPGVYFWVASIGVIIFAGLSAYKTQQIKQIYLTNGGQGNLAIIGALTLYISFLNIFVFLLALFGGGSSD